MVRTIFQKLSLILLGTIIFVILTEGILRAIGYNPAFRQPIIFQKSTSRELVFELKPGSYDQNFSGVNVKINSMGFRDYEYSLVKPKNKKRIIGIGDSILFGYCVNLENSCLKVLERMLNEKYPNKFEVINAAIPGYDLEQEVCLLEKRLMEFSPDIVIWQFCWNDIADPVIEADSYFIKHYSNTGVTPEFPLKSFLRKHSALYLFAREGLHGLLKAPRKIDKKLWESDIPYKSFIDSINKAKKILENKVELLVVIFPSLKSNPLFDTAHAKLHEICRSKEISFVDLSDIFKVYGENLMVAKTDLYHPNIKGHQIAAEEIYKKLTPKIPPCRWN